MRTKAGYLALTGECLTVAALMWTLWSTLLLKDAEVPVPGMIVVLALTALNMIVFCVVFRKETSYAAAAVCAAVLLGISITVYLLLYKDSLSFGYVLSMLLVSVVTDCLPLYYCIREQPLTKHLVLIDVMLLALLWLFLFLPVLQIEPISLVCAVALILVDIGGAVALRMSEGGMEEGIGKAFVLAVASAGVAAAVVLGLVKIFSRSGNATGAILAGFKAVFLKIWQGIQALADWLSRFISPIEGELPPEAAPQTAGVEQEIELTGTGIDPAVIAAVLGAAAALIVILVVFRFRKKRITMKISAAGSAGVIRKKNKKKRSRWLQKLLEDLVFRKNAFLYRNTPKGVLVWLERQAVKAKVKRGRGESIREFLRRMAPDGMLDVLADDLDAGLYGSAAYRLSPQECRKLKGQFRKEYRNRKKSGVPAAAV